MATWVLRRMIVQQVLNFRLTWTKSVSCWPESFDIFDQWLVDSITIIKWPHDDADQQRSQVLWRRALRSFSHFGRNGFGADQLPP